jgi:hypothetical protein
MPNDASVSSPSAGLTRRVRLALESGDLDAIRDLLDPAPAGVRRKVQVIAIAIPATRSWRGGPGRERPARMRWSLR